MPTIAPSADVDPRAIVADDVEIGPFCVVGPHVRIGRGTKLANHVTLTGHVTLGAENRIFANAVIGAEPQDLSYRGSPTRVEIGDGNVIREGVTINRASEKEAGVTRIGHRCYLMANSHVAHDCTLGDRVIVANGTLLGGHVQVEDCVTISGAVAVHHYATIGAYAFVSGVSRVLQDVPPYLLVEGVPTRPRCLNLVGLKRHGFSMEAIHALHEAYKLLYRSRVGVDQARDLLRAAGQLLPPVNHLLGFVQEQGEGRHGRSRDRRRAA